MTIEEVKDKLELRLIDLIKYLYLYKKGSKRFTIKFCY